MEHHSTRAGTPRAGVIVGVLVAMLVILQVPSGAGEWVPLVQASQVPASCPPRVALRNGSFEEPAHGGVTFIQPLEKDVPGWETTATDGKIEIWVGGYLGVTAADGRQHAELNANQPSTLYDDVATLGGQTVFWRLQHRGRSGVDTMALEIGAPLQSPPPTIATMSDPAGAWSTYQGSVVIPNGQPITRFGFSSRSTASGNPTIGNFVDDLFLGTPPCDVVTKSVTPAGTVPSGTELTYRIGVRNEGGDVSSDTVIADIIPAGARYVPGSLRIVEGPGSGPKTDSADADEASFDSLSNRVVFNLGRLANVSTLPRGIVAEFRAGATGSTPTVTNVATVTYQNLLASPPQTLVSTSNDATTDVSPSADLAVTQHDAPDPVFAGQQIGYSIQVRNNGPSAASAVELVEYLGQGLSLVSATPSQGTCDTTLTCRLGTMPAGGSITVTVVATATMNGELSSVAAVRGDERDPLLTNNAARVDTTVLASSDITISKSASTNSIAIGQVVTFTLDVVNQGPTSATGVRVIDHLPSGLELVSATPGQGTCTGTSVVTCELGTLAVNAPTSVTVVARGVTSGAQLNAAAAAGFEADPNVQNNAAMALVVVGAPPPSSADVRITMAGPAVPIPAGSRFRYTLTVTNAGPDPATNVTVVDELPPGLSLVSVTPSDGGSCSGTVTVACSLGSLQPVASATVTIEVVAAEPGSRLNAAVVLATETDPAPANNIAIASITILPVVDLAVSNAIVSAGATVGRTATIRSTVRNLGAGRATSVAIGARLPLGTTLVSATPSQGGPCGTASGVLTCQVGTLDPGTSASVDVVLRLDRSGTFTYVAAATGAEPDVDRRNNLDAGTGSIPLPVAVADLAAAETVDRARAAIGDTVTFTITARNDGPARATNVLVRAFLPAGLDLVALTTTHGTCGSLQPAGCQVGELDVGALAAVTVAARVTGPGLLTVVGVAQSDADDPNLENNRAAATVDVDSDTPVPAPSSTPVPIPSLTPVPTPSPTPERPPDRQPDDDSDRPRRLTEDERRQRERTNRSNRDDAHTEGNVVGVRCSLEAEEPTVMGTFVAGPNDVPYALIATRDGIQQVRLVGDARGACTTIQVGDYLEADGEKQHEHLFDADGVKIRAPMP